MAPNGLVKCSSYCKHLRRATTAATTTTTETKHFVNSFSLDECLSLYLEGWLNFKFQHIFFCHYTSLPIYNQQVTFLQLLEIGDVLLVLRYDTTYPIPLVNKQAKQTINHTFLVRIWLNGIPACLTLYILHKTYLVAGVLRQHGGPLVSHVVGDGPGRKLGSKGGHLPVHIVVGRSHRVLEVGEVLKQNI